MIIKALTRPFKLCLEHKLRSSLWAIYIIFGGLLGVVINLINRWIFGEMSFEEALYAESIGGTFYTYAIVLISAAIGPLFFNISESKTLHFPDIKAFTITICFFVMVFGAVFYSNLEDKVTCNLYLAKECDYSIDWAQLIFFILSVILALYSYGIEYLDKDVEHNKDIDSSAEYIKQEDKEVKKLETANPYSAGDGVII